MYDQIREDILYMIFYGAAAMLSLVACCYLLFRRANAIAPDITSSVRLRWWTAALFASMTLSHVWYMPTFFLTSSEDVLLSNIVGAVLDFMTLIPLGIAVLFVMLQNRRRPLWPIFAMMAPIILGLAMCSVNRNITILPVLYAYYLLLGIGLIIYDTCDKTIRALAARQLCRPGAQGGVAEFRSAGHHAACCGLLCL